MSIPIVPEAPAECEPAQAINPLRPLSDIPIIDLERMAADAEGQRLLPIASNALPLRIRFQAQIRLATLSGVTLRDILTWFPFVPKTARRLWHHEPPKPSFWRGQGQDPDTLRPGGRRLVEEAVAWAAAAHGPLVSNGHGRSTVEDAAIDRLLRDGLFTRAQLGKVFCANLMGTARRGADAVQRTNATAGLHKQAANIQALTGQWTEDGCLPEPHASDFRQLLVAENKTWAEAAEALSERWQRPLTADAIGYLVKREKAKNPALWPERLTRTGRSFVQGKHPARAAAADLAAKYRELRRVDDVVTWWNQSHPNAPADRCLVLDILKASMPEEFEAIAAVARLQTMQGFEHRRRASRLLQSPDLCFTIQQQPQIRTGTWQQYVKDQHGFTAGSATIEYVRSDCPRARRCRSCPGFVFDGHDGAMAGHCRPCAGLQPAVLQNRWSLVYAWLELKAHAVTPSLSKLEEATSWNSNRFKPVFLENWAGALTALERVAARVGWVPLRDDLADLPEDHKARVCQARLGPLLRMATGRNQRQT